MSKQRIWICVIVALAGLISLYFYSTSDMRWDLVSKQFMKSENNYVYDARNFRIHENEMISLRFIDRWDKSKATIHVGSIENSKQTFSEKAQDGTWWLSPDWEVIYLSTRRFDEDTDSSSSRNNRTTQTNKLWKSTDGGHHWERLAWPKQQRIKAIHFLNEQEGFAIGMKPHIWHTNNGGEDWRDIELPFQTNSSNTRKAFDSTTLDKNNTLYLAFAPVGATEPISEIWRIKQGKTTPEFMFTVPGNEVSSIFSDDGSDVYVLSVGGSKTEYDQQTSTLYQWDNKKLNELHSLPTGLRRGDIDQTPTNKYLLVHGRYNGSNAQDWAALSKNGGKSWHLDKGRSTQGSYYDAATGINWSASGHTLYKREFP